MQATSLPIIIIFIFFFFYKLPNKITQMMPKSKPKIQPIQKQVYKKDSSISNLTQPHRPQHHTVANNPSKPQLSQPTTNTSDHFPLDVAQPWLRLGQAVVLFLG